jgi:hypothetical protein
VSFVCSLNPPRLTPTVRFDPIGASNPHRHEIPGSVRASVPAHNVHRQVAAGLLVSLLAFAFTLWRKRRTREMLL